MTKKLFVFEMCRASLLLIPFRDFAAVTTKQLIHAENFIYLFYLFAVDHLVICNLYANAHA